MFIFFRTSSGSIKTLANKGIDIILSVSRINIRKFSTKTNLNFLNSLTDKIFDNFFIIKNIVFCDVEKF